MELLLHCKAHFKGGHRDLYIVVLEEVTFAPFIMYVMNSQFLHTLHVTSFRLASGLARG